MFKYHSYDAVIVGSGPNGFAAAIQLAAVGLTTVIVEAKECIGGGMRSAELTLPGFTHDICSAIHPLAVSSPFFQSLPLDKFGLEWIYPPAALAHPFEDGSAALLEHSLERTASTLYSDSLAYIELMSPLIENWPKIQDDLLGPLHIPKHPIKMLSFISKGLRSANGLITRYFRAQQARSLFAGLAAHSILPLEQPITAAFGLILGILGHRIGWPMPRGGSQKIADALSAYYLSLGGEIVTGFCVEKIEDLPKSQLIFCDITPKQLLKIADRHLSHSYKKKLEGFRYGPGVFKMDWALHQPIPWTAKECLKAGTVHLGATSEAISESERLVWQGKCSPKPYTLIAQQSLFDDTRAPPGKHTAWGYCHVPNGYDGDMSEKIERQLETFAPGFRDCIIARSTLSALDMQSYNANYIGGDINGGVQDLYQLFSRPAHYFNPYVTSNNRIYICSSSTPPGGGVHGMCGYHAARAALKTMGIK